MAENENNQQGEKKMESSGDQPSGGVMDLDRSEGQTNNGVIGGTGSDLDKATERLGGSPIDSKEEK